MIEYKKYIPTRCYPIIVKTPYGVRRAIFDRNSCFYCFTDCTHPMQNCYLPESDILQWEYADNQYMEDLLFTENLYYKEQQLKATEMLLEKIKPPTFLESFKHYIKTKINL